MRISVPRPARRITIGMCFCALLLLGPVASGAPPRAYRPTSTTLSSGLDHTRYVRADPAVVVNVARMHRGADLRLRAVPAGGRVGGGLERTTSICRRVRCIVAVNGDFWKPGTSTPVGGVVSLGELLRSPSLDHAQVTILRDGTLRTGPLRLTASLVAEDLRPLRIDAVNRSPRVDEIVLMTPAHGATTGTPRGTVELRVDAKSGTKVLRLSETTVVELAANGNDTGNIPIPRGGAVLAGHGKGAAAIRALLARARSGETSRDALLRLESTPRAAESLGGSPVLVSGGRVLARPETNSFVRGRHPRTVIGWTRSGDVLLVTIDGRQPGYSDGMTLPEAARFMVSLGAVEAVNLDGGGSTTFVVDGSVVNRPSDRAVRAGDRTRIVHVAEGPRVIGHVERPVAIALVVVPKDPSSAEVIEPNIEALRDLRPVRIVDVPVPHASDVASDPSGTLPVVALSVVSGPDRRLLYAAAALVALALLLAAVGTAYEHGHRIGLRRRRLGAR